MVLLLPCKILADEEQTPLTLGGHVLSISSTLKNLLSASMIAKATRLATIKFLHKIIGWQVQHVTMISSFSIEPSKCMFHADSTQPR